MHENEKTTRIFFCTWKKYFLSQGQPELCKKFSGDKIKLMVDHMFLL